MPKLIDFDDPEVMSKYGFIYSQKYNNFEQGDHLTEKYPGKLKQEEMDHLKSSITDELNTNANISHANSEHQRSLFGRLLQQQQAIVKVHQPIKLEDRKDLINSEFKQRTYEHLGSPFKKMHQFRKRSDYLDNLEKQTGSPFVQKGEATSSQLLIYNQLVASPTRTGAS